MRYSLFGQRGNQRCDGRKDKARRVANDVFAPGLVPIVLREAFFATVEQDEQIVAALLGGVDDAGPNIACQGQLVDLALQMLSLFQVGREMRVGFLCGDLLSARQSCHGQLQGGVERRQNRLKQIVSRRSAVMDEQHAVHTDSGRSQFRHSPARRSLIFGMRLPPPRSK